MAPIKEWFGGYNVIYNWFEKKYGYNALEEYWKFIADSCFCEVIERFRRESLQGIQKYFEETFDLDDGKYSSKLSDDCLVFDVTKCPDYDFMNSSENPNFKAIKNYCRHHDVINTVMAEKSGHCFKMAECDNSGRCRWIFEKNDGSRIKRGGL